MKHIAFIPANLLLAPLASAHGILDADKQSNNNL